jgi:hypothetical protein
LNIHKPVLALADDFSVLALADGFSVLALADGFSVLALADSLSVLEHLMMMIDLCSTLQIHFRVEIYQLESYLNFSSLLYL